MAVLGSITHESEIPIFEVRTGRYGIPEAYRFHKDARVGHRLKDGRLITLERGQVKGNYINVHDIYLWLSQQSAV